MVRHRSSVRLNRDPSNTGAPNPDQCKRISSFHAIHRRGHDAAIPTAQETAMSDPFPAIDPSSMPTRAAIRAHLRALARASRVQGAPIFTRAITA
jgi:hypothetical protein